MNLCAINNVYPHFTLNATGATKDNSRVNFFMFKDLDASEITVLDKGLVVIGRAPGGAKYVSNDEVLKGYVYDPLINYAYDPERLSRDVEFLKKLGISTVIDTRNRKYEGMSCIDAERRACEKNNIKYISIELDSAKPPTDEDLEKFFGAIDEANEKNGKIYIHCHAGKDRTGILASCYLARYQGLGSDEAFKMVFDNREDNEHPGKSIQRLKYMNFPDNIIYKEKFLKLLEQLRKEYQESLK